MDFFKISALTNKIIPKINRRAIIPSSDSKTKKLRIRTNTSILKKRNNVTDKRTNATPRAKNFLYKGNINQD